MKYLKQFENFQPTYFSDVARMDSVEEVLNKIKENDEEYLEDIEDEPHMDSLLDPYDGYERQTYVQYNNNKLIYWEGWSEFCWKSLYDKPEYKRLPKEKAIKKVIDERLVPSMESMGLKYVNSDYWYEESWTDGVEDGFIMKVVFEL